MPNRDRIADTESESVFLTQCRRVVHLEAYAVEGLGYVIATLSDGTSDEITAEQALEIGRIGGIAQRMAEEDLLGGAAA
ncbi:hypothetical protein [Nocardia sp. NPDC004722]